MAETDRLLGAFSKGMRRVLGTPDAGCLSPRQPCRTTKSADKNPAAALNNQQHLTTLRVSPPRRRSRERGGSVFSLQTV